MRFSLRFAAAISQGFRTCLKLDATKARQKLHGVAATKIACEGVDLVSKPQASAYLSPPPTEGVVMALEAFSVWKKMVDVSAGKQKLRYFCWEKGKLTATRNQFLLGYFVAMMLQAGPNLTIQLVACPCNVYGLILVQPQKLRSKAFTYLSRKHIQCQYSLSYRDNAHKYIPHWYGNWHTCQLYIKEILIQSCFLILEHSPEFTQAILTVINWTTA